jgi:glutamate carboxypeptidase
MTLTSNEQALVESAAATPMLAQVERWAAINSGTRNLDGLKAVAGLLADEFAALPGDLVLVKGDPVESVAASGTISTIMHGDHLHLCVRPNAAVQMLFTGHMDTVFATDHPFQTMKWLEPGVLNGPGVADMKGGIAVMLAALKAVEASSTGLGYEVIINSDEEVGSPSSAAATSQLSLPGKALMLVAIPMMGAMQL